MILSDKSNHFTYINGFSVYFDKRSTTYKLTSLLRWHSYSPGRFEVVSVNGVLGRFHQTQTFPFAVGAALQRPRVAVLVLLFYPRTTRPSAAYCFQFQIWLQHRHTHVSTNCNGILRVSGNVWDMFSVFRCLAFCWHGVVILTLHRLRGTGCFFTWRSLLKE